MRFLGAKVVLTPAAEKGSGMLAKAVELAETHGWFLCRQFENEANADMHSPTTAEEILADFAGKGLDYWVTGYGTGGTLKGVARVLRKRSPGHEDRRLRARQLADLDERHPPAAHGRRRAAGKPSELSAAPDAGLDARLHPEAHRGRGRGEADRSHRADRRRRRDARSRASSRSRRGSSSASRAARRSPARWRSRRSAPARARRSSACCPTPASAI